MDGERNQHRIRVYCKYEVESVSGCTLPSSIRPVMRESSQVIRDAALGFKGAVTQSQRLT